MKIRLIDGIEVQRGSSNVYADLGLPAAEKLKIKTGLVIEIRKAMRSGGLAQQEAAKRMGITSDLCPVCSRICHGCKPFFAALVQ